MPRSARSVLNGGTIVDAARQRGLLSLPATGSDGLATQHIVIQTLPAPAVAGISPASGPTTGDTIVAITGGTHRRYRGGLRHTTATNFAVDSATQITATSPAGTGTVDVTVTGPAGVSGKWSADRFTYDTTWGPLLPLPPGTSRDRSTARRPIGTSMPADPMSRRPCVTGCVATAEAQVLYFLAFPAEHFLLRRERQLHVRKGRMARSISPAMRLRTVFHRSPRSTFGLSTITYNGNPNRRGAA